MIVPKLKKSSLVDLPLVKMHIIDLEICECIMVWFPSRAQEIYLFPTLAM